jgi:hypothetical protein
MGLFKRKPAIDASQGGAQQDWGEWMAQRLPPEVQDAYRQAAGQDRAAKAEAAGPDRFAEALERAASEPAPPGKVRGVAKMTAGDQEYVHPETGAGAQPTDRYLHVVLEVHIPGREPYEVQRRSMRFPRKDLLGGGYPVLVEAGDDRKLDVVWDEMPEHGAAVAERLSAGMQQAGAGAAAASQQSILNSLSAVQDPKQREALARQMREMGYEIPPEAGD